MRRWAAAVAAGAAVLAGAGCAAPRWSAGERKQGYQVEARGKTLDEARRQAVSRFFDLFLSTGVQAGSSEVLEREILSKAGSFILEERSREEGGATRLSAAVAWARLGRALDALGLARGAALATRPKLALRLSEDGGQAAAGAALRRRLAALGYTFSDSQAAVIVTGSSRTTVPEGSLDGFSSAQVTLDLRAKTPRGTELASIEQPAGAVDARAEDAAAKALDSAGLLAADKLHADLSSQFHQATEYTVTVLELGDLDRARQFMAALRALPPVVDAALDAVSDKDFRVRVYVDRLAIDEMTAQLLHLRAFNLHVRGVEPDFSAIELASGDSY